MTAGLYPGAREPIWFGDRKVYSVTGFVEGVRSRIVDLPGFWVHGEISDFRHQQRFSMVYFTLKDPENGYTLSCTISRTRFEALQIELRDGDMVHVFGRPDIYSPQGKFQLRAQTVQHTGRGLLMQQLEALKARLAAEGLFDDARKRPLPFLPRRIGVITGADTAARGDFLRNVLERYPPAKLVLCETLVQGDRAAPQLVVALRKLQRIEDVDVIVITRGGGAFEHFLPFSDERLLRAIAACPVPVVSAIGHEKDSPLSDLVADLRVSTPTAAARTVVPDHGEVSGKIERLRDSLRRRGTARMQRRIDVLATLRARLASQSPAHFVRHRRGHIEQLRGRARSSVAATVRHRGHHLTMVARSLGRCMETGLQRRVARHAGAVGRLRALSPRSTLDRGYAIVRTPDGHVMCDAADAQVGGQVTMILARGEFDATVDAVREGSRIPDDERQRHAPER